MIELKFFRDEKNVYFNNPNGITIKKSIEDFEKWITGEGGGGSVGTIKVAASVVMSSKRGTIPANQSSKLNFTVMAINPYTGQPFDDLTGICDFLVEDGRELPVKTALQCVAYSVNPYNLGGSITLYNPTNEDIEALVASYKITYTAYKLE